jgi:cytochrome c biogenesis protein CcmG/thiol:disulfide interchange protein DsbE
MRTRVLVAVGLAALVLATFIVLQRLPHTQVDPSKHGIAPDFSLTDLDGRKITLDAYRGKVVLLNFWATWCEPCRAEIPRFIQFQNTYGTQGLQVLGISMDDDSKPVHKFRDEFRLNYPVAMGDAKLGESYGGVLGLPITFLIDPQGRIFAKHIGAVDPAIIENELRKLLPASSAKG